MESLTPLLVSPRLQNSAWNVYGVFNHDFRLTIVIGYLLACIGSTFVIIRLGKFDFIEWILSLIIFTLFFSYFVRRIWKTTRLQG